MKNLKPLITIDLGSELGNAICVGNLAMMVGRMLGVDASEVDDMRREMFSSHYDDLLDTIDRWLPNTFKFISDPRPKARITTNAAKRVVENS